MIRRPVAAAASLLGGGLIALALLVGAFSPADVHALGWDAAGYAVQIRAARDGVLDLPASRPGVAVAGAVLDGIGVVPAGLAPTVLSLVGAVCVGFAGTVAFRRTLPVPGWAVGGAVVLAATWGGTTRLTAGYLANLLALALFLGGIALALRTAPRWPVVAAAFAGSLLVHPGVAPAWGAILVGWIAVEAIARRDRGPERALEALVALLAASVVVALVVALGLGLTLDDLQDLGVVEERFDERAAEIVAWIQPALTAVMALGGVLAAVLIGSEQRSRAAERLGIAWVVVCAAGLPLLALAPSVPTHRLALLAVPIPLLGASAIAGGVERLASRFGTVGSRIAPVAAGAVAVGVAVLSLQPFDARSSRASPSIGPAPSEVAGYLRAADVRVPVVLVMDPPDRRGVLAWKARLNAVRALAPDGLMLRIVAYVGDERTLAAGRPTGGNDLVEAVTDRTWPSVRAVLDEPHASLVVRSWVRSDTWARVQWRAVSEEVAVLEGPAPRTEIIPAAVPSIAALEGFLVVLGTIVLLGGLGLGWARRVAGSDPIDVVGLSPIAGLAVAVFGGIVAGLVGADPGGPVGCAIVAAIAVGGWVPVEAWRVGRRPA